MTTRSIEEVEIVELQENGEDPYMDLLQEILTRVGNIEEAVEELGEKISDIGLNMEVPAAYDS